MLFIRLFNKILVIILISHFSPAFSNTRSNHGGCIFENINEIEWQNGKVYSVKDNFTGTMDHWNSSMPITSFNATYDENCENCIEMKLDNDDIQIDINILQNFSNFEKSLPDSFELNAKIEIKCMGVSSLDVKFKIEDTNNHDPVLMTPETIHLTMPVLKNTEIPPDIHKITATDIDFYNTNIEFQIRPDEYFEISTEYDKKLPPNKRTYTPTITTKKNMYITEDYTVWVTATDNPKDPTESRRSVTKAITIKANSVPIPVFEKPLYRAIYDTESDELKQNVKISLKENYNATTFILEPENGDFKENFVLNDDYSEITIKDKLTEEQIKDISYIIIFVTAVFERQGSDEKTNGKTVVIIDLKKPKLETVVKYDKDSYEYNTRDDYVGLLDTIKASSSDCSETIIYSVDNIDSNIIQFISYGPELKIKEKAPKGSYHFTLHAEGGTSSQKTATKVILTISDTYKFENKLIIKNLAENLYHDNIIHFKDGDKYDISIEETYPSDFHDMFEIKPNDGNQLSLSMKSVDRENSTFKDMLVPQIQVWLKAEPKAEDQKRIKRETSETDRHWINTKNINNDLNKMVLTVIIDDENDNDPEFVNTPDPLVIAYPSPGTISIAPPYLTKVTARDLDSGDNGKVSYSIKNNDKFIIDSNSGTITPTSDAFVNCTEVEFTVIASDHGTSSRTAELTIKVKLLIDNQISVIAVDDITNDQIDDFFEKLNKNSTHTGVVFGFLAASPDLSSGDNNNAITNSNKSVYVDQHKSKMRIVTYAINQTSDEALPTDEIENIPGFDLGDDSKLNNIKDTPLNCQKDGCPKCDECSENDETGYIVAVSILSVVLVVIIIYLGIKIIRKRGLNTV